jgi:hypothetical protein
MHMGAFPEEERPVRFARGAVAPDAKEALGVGIQIANEIADGSPLGIRTSLASAHLAIDHGEEEALSKLDKQFGALFHTQDFLEGRKAEEEEEEEEEEEGRKPVYQGNERGRRGNRWSRAQRAVSFARGSCTRRPVRRCAPYATLMPRWLASRPH